IEGSNDLSIWIDFRDEQNRVLLRVNKNGVVNRSPNLTVLHPNKSTFLIEDEYGAEFLKAIYINPYAFQISGNMLYCGKILPINSRMTDSCFGTSPFGIARTT